MCAYVASVECLVCISESGSSGSGATAVMYAAVRLWYVAVDVASNSVAVV